MKHSATILVSLALLAPSTGRADLTSASWQHAGGGGIVEGTALGDVDGDGRAEIALTLRNGWYQADAGLSATLGTLVLLNDAGTVLWQAQRANTIGGFPTLGDFDGDGLAEIAVCEMAPTGVCAVYDGDGTPLFETPPLHWPANTNGGVTAADVNEDGIDDLIVATWGADIGVFAGPTGAALWHLDMWTHFADQFGLSWGDYFFGYPAVGDIDADGDLDVVACSHYFGALYAFEGMSGIPHWSLDPSANPAVFPVGNYCHGSGPMLVDLDGVPGLEIVLTLSHWGTASSAVAAYGNDGASRWRTEVTPNSLYFSSPTSADLDGDNSVEVLVQTLEGVLLVLDSTGAIVNTTDLGAESWMSPGIIDAGADGNFDVMAGTVSSLFILDGASFNALDRFDSPTSGLFPPPVQGDTDSDGRVELFTGAWWPKQFFKFDLTDLNTYAWPTYAAGSTHDGTVVRVDTTSDPTDDPLIATQPIPAVEVVILLTDELAVDAATAPDAAKDLEDHVIKKLEDAQKDIADGKLKDALKHALESIEEMLKVTDEHGVNTDELQRLAALAAMRIAREFRDRAQAIMGPTHAEIVTASDKIDDAYTKIAAGDFAGACAAVLDATEGLQKKLTYVGDFCPSSPEEIYLFWLCQVQADRQIIVDWSAANPGDGDLKSAVDEIEVGIQELASLGIEKGIDRLTKTVDKLISSDIDTSSLQPVLSQQGGRLARLAIDASAVARDPGEPDIIAAEALFSEAEAYRVAGDHKRALEHYRQAVGTARP